MGFWHRLRLWFRLNAVEARMGQVENSLREAVHALSKGQTDRDSTFRPCWHCGAVYHVNRLTEATVNDRNEIRNVLVCGTCHHIVRKTGRGR